MTKNVASPYLEILFAPNMGRETGWLKINTGNKECWTSSGYEVPGITTAKDWNKVQLAIRRKGTAMEIWINGKKVASCDKAILPATQAITKVEIRMLDKIDKRNRYLIGEVKIEKKD